MEQKQTHFTYGLITAIVMVIVGLILYLTGLAFKSSEMKYVAQVPFLIGIIMNAVAFSKANDGYVTFGNVFGSCFKMAMIVALIMVVWSIVQVFVFPDMKDKVMDMVRQEMAKKSNVTDEQIEMTLGYMKKYWTTMIIAGALFSTLFWGAIFSLIGGAIAKKNGQRPITSGDNF